jgi:hypothetical protein
MDVQLRVHTVNIDLVNHMAHVMLVKHGQPKATAVEIHVPVRASGPFTGDPPEQQLKRAALREAETLLREAIEVLAEGGAR